jgi:hypothetical protein
MGAENVPLGPVGRAVMPPTSAARGSVFVCSKTTMAALTAAVCAAS